MQSIRCLSRSISGLLRRFAFVAMALLALTPESAWAQAQIQTQSPTESLEPAQVETMPPAPPEDTQLDAQIDAQTAVRLSDVEGSVQLSDAGGKLFDQVLQNMVMLPGMTLETGNDGRAELEFADGSVVRVTPNSALTIAAPTESSSGSLLLVPVKGLTYYEMSPSGEEFAVQVGRLTARGLPGVNVPSDLLLVNLDATPYEAAALRGAVHFEDASGTAAYDLDAGQTARVDPESAFNYDIVLSLVPDTWDAWNNDRDAALAQIASAAHPAGEETGPGWDDLNYYGSWYNVPDAGMAWAPDGVGADFDPYGSGAWGYYTGAGYTWVSSYPWGWLPYHCGAWNFYPGYGWMWQPVNCGWRSGSGVWSPWLPVHTAPPRYRNPHRPLPPTGIHPPLRSQTLIAVERGAPTHFRRPGQARPTPRTLMVAGVAVQPLPPAARPSYRSSLPAGQVPLSGQSSGFAQTAQTGQGTQTIYMTGSRTVLPTAPYTGLFPPRSSAPQRPPTYLPPARTSPPMRSAPPPAPVSAPHISAPSSGASSGHGH